MPSHPRLSIVVPFFNESLNVGHFFDRLLPVLASQDLSWEIICVNDGSRDDTLDRLIEAHRHEPRIKVLDLSRNFGKEQALSAGLSNARGDAVIPMDADLQHPPELIPQFLEKWREGYDVVYAIRRQRTGQSLLSRAQAKAFYWLFDKLSDVPLPREVGDFRLLDRKVVDVINAMPERTRFMKGIFAWVGFRQVGIPYEQEERLYGESKWGMMKLMSFAFDGLVAFSDYPLRIWAVVGSVISGFAFLYIVIRLIKTLVYGIDVPGYESIIVIMLFLGGVQLITLGIIGHYLGRVFNEVKGRPLFIIRSRIGLGDDAEGPGQAGRVRRDV
ncbi:glycosyltransferase family 2 protein [Telmatospirillum siberiense]|uniref:Glycosyltransferase n=1 Tax=Telmatospirillum siberiense TaxID=382514 RepID=A0A2N3PT04_9PROT|nr:glycosyltransferase family 2 protein [Telmatospirillum siberiense]PKU23524.1 glycosyltransferase [Telmatospirillum siberiense]